MADETPPGETPGNQGETPTPPSFDGWLATQPDDVKSLVAGHTSGLKSALEAERNERKTAAKQLRDALAKAEKGSETEKALQEITGRAETAERRAAFFEEGARPEIGCSNLKAAFLVATAENLFSRTGDPDWKRIKDAAPELFQRPQTTANAGSGTQTPPKGASMNDFIRRAAGRS